MIRIALIAVVVLAACSQMNPPPGSFSTQIQPPERASPSARVLAPVSSAPAPPPSPSRPASPGTIGARCPITQPNRAKPPDGEASDDSYLGNGRLWTVMWPKGLVLVPHDGVEPDGALSMKFPWWRAAGVHGALHSTVYELALEVPVRADIPDGYGDTGFQASGIVFPVEGCYRITGAAAGTELMFVTMVRSCSAIAELPPADRTLYSICDR